MSLKLRYRCLNCGERFEATILTDEELREAQRQVRRLFAVHSQRCNRTEVKKGW